MLNLKKGNVDRKKIIISGWYGNENIGDDAQLACIISMIRFFFPNAAITVFSDNPERVKREHGVNSFNRNAGKWERLRKIYGADLFILGGGTLLYDQGGRSSATLIKWLNNCILSKLAGTPVMLFNGGVGLLFKKQSLFYVKNVCEAMDLITVRDKSSKNNLEVIGVKNQIYIGADSTFAMPDYFVQDTQQPDKISNSKRPLIGFNVRSWLYRKHWIKDEHHIFCAKYLVTQEEVERQVKVFSKVIDYVVTAYNADVIFLSFSYLNAKYDYDNELIDEILGFVEHKDRVKVLREKNSYLELVKLIVEMDLVIGMRLHSLIFAALANVPMIGINYAPKNEAFMQMIGQGLYSIDIRDFNEEFLIHKVDELWEKKDKFKQGLAIKVTEFKERAKGSARFMSELLSKKLSRAKLSFQGLILIVKILLYKIREH